MTKQARPVLYLDGGNMLYRAVGVMERATETTSAYLQAQFVGRAMEEMGVMAANVARRDLAGGLELLKKLVEDTRLPLISANLKDSQGKRPFPRWVRLGWGDLTVGVFGLIKPSALYDGIAGVRIDNPVESAREAVSALSDADVVICLSDLGIEGEKGLAITVPGIDLIIGAGRKGPQYQPVTQNDTLILYGNDRGRFVGVMDVDSDVIGDGWQTPSPKGLAAAVKRRLAALEKQLEHLKAQPIKSPKDAAERRRNLKRAITSLQQSLDETPATGATFVHILHPLNAAVGDHPKVAAKLAEFRSSFTAPRRPGTKPSGIKSLPALPPPANAAYAGTTSCGRCHTTQRTKWLRTPHPRALIKLSAEKRGEEKCLACHATKVDRMGRAGWESAVGCESCHGPGSGHGRDASGIVRKVAETTCGICHSGFHEEKFDFSVGYEKIRCDKP